MIDMLIGAVGGILLFLLANKVYKILAGWHFYLWLQKNNIDAFKLNDASLMTAKKAYDSRKTHEVIFEHVDHRGENKLGFLRNK